MIQIKDVSFSYGRRAKLFDRLDLSLDSNHIYGLLGRNGAGKTTLLKMMMGMLFPKSGTCHVLGHESRQRKPAMLSDVLFVPEEFYTPTGSIRQHVDLYAPLYPAFDRKQFDAYLDELQLSKSDRFRSLSLGQKKKAILGFALAANTRALILDEPTNGLDIPSKAQFRRMVASTASDDRCIIISTHQVRDIDKLIDSVVIIDNSRVVLHQSVGEITEKLAFNTGSELTGKELYSEDSIAGSLTVSPNTGEATQINLELLFNAVMLNPEAIRNIFQTDNKF
jgi:ABC-2 type transport system ATP-binding protein